MLRRRPSPPQRHPSSGRLSPRAWWERPPFWVLVSGGAFLLFFSRVIWGAWVLSPPFTDIYRISYPFLRFFDWSLHQGSVPLWNPFQFAGHPYAGNGEGAAFYLPKILLCLLFDGTSLLGWHAWLHAWLGWVAMFFLARSYGWSLPANLLAATGWVFSGMAMGILPWVAHIAGTVVWFPLALLIIRTSPGRPVSLSIVLLACCTALQTTGSIANFTAPYALLAGGFGLWLGVSAQGKKQKLSLLVVTCGGLALGYLLSAVHLLPTFEMASMSQRVAAGTSDGMQSGVGLLFNVSANFGGDLSRWWDGFKSGTEAGKFFFPANTAQSHERDGFYLLPFLLLAGWAGVVAALRRRQGPEWTFLAIAAILGLIFSSNNPLRTLVYSLVPALSVFQVTAKFSVWYTLAMVLLAAKHLDAPGPRGDGWKWSGGVLVLGLLVFFLFTGPSGPSAYPADLKSQHLTLFLLISAAATAAWYAWSRREKWHGKFLWILAALAAVGGGTLTWWFLYTHDMSIPRQGYYTENELTRFLENEGRRELFRVLPIRINMYPNTESVYRFQGLNGYAPMHWQRYTEIMKAAESDGDPYLRPDLTQMITPNTPRTDILALLNTKYVISRQGVSVVPGYAPRAWLSARYEVVADKKERLARLHDGRFSRSVTMLEEDPHWSPVDSTGAGDSVAFALYEPERLELRTTSAGSRILTLSENNLPGWQAFVDGDPVHVYASYHILRSVLIPAGNHTVLFRYRPDTVVIGAILSCAGLAIMMLLAVLTLRHRRPIAPHVPTEAP